MSVAATYAEALYEAAHAQSAVDQVRSELNEFAEAMAPGSEPAPGSVRAKQACVSPAATPGRKRPQ